MKMSLSQKVYAQLVEEIIEGEIGQDIVLTENMLIEKYGISKSPVREALIRLCNEDILYSIPRFGYKVKIVDQAYLEGIIRFRLNVEPAYLEYYFDIIREEDVQRIEKKIVIMDRNEFLTPAEYWKKTSFFHLELAYTYHDKFFYDTMVSILDKQLITFSKLYWNNWGSIIDSKLSDNHIDILEAIKDRNRDLSVELLIKDIQSF